MATVRELQARISASAEGMKSTLRGIKKDITDLGRTTDKSMDVANRSLETLGSSSRELENIIKKSDNPKEFERLQKAIQNAENELRETGQISDRVMNQLRSSTNSSVDALNSLGEEGRESIRQIGRSINSIESDFDGLQEEIQESEKDLEGFGSRFKSIIGGIAGGIGLGGAISQALDISSLDTTIDISMNVPEESVETVKSTVRDVTAIIGDQGEALEGVRRQWALNADASDEANANVIRNASVVARAYQGIDFTELIQEVNEIANELEITNDEAVAMANSLLRAGFPPEQIDIISEYGQQLANAGYEAEEIQAIFSAGVETGTWNIDNLLDSLKEGRIRLAEFGREVPDSIGELLEGTTLTVEKLKEWGQAVAEGGEEGKQAYSEVAEALSEVEDGTTKNLIGVELFGTLWEDQGENILETITNMDDHLVDMEENQNALNESLEKMEDDPAIRLRNAMNDLKVAAAPVLEVITDIIIKITDWMRDNPETVRSLGKLGAQVGLLGSALGVVSPILSGLIGLFGFGGGVGGKGLAGTLLRLVSKAGPVGLAIGAIGSLTLGIIGATKATRENADEILDSFNARREEVEQLDSTISRYEELQEKNKLSSDEVLRYMDIMDELANANNQETIQKLREEQEQLLEKSKLTNQEIDEFLSLNDAIIEKSPATISAISEQGNEFAGNLELLKNMNQQERESLEREYYLQLQQGSKGYNDNLEDSRELQKEINELEEIRPELQRQLNETIDNDRALREQRLDLQNQINEASGEEKRILEFQLEEVEKNIRSNITKMHIAEDTLETNREDLGVSRENLDEVNKQISAYEDLYMQHEQVLLLNEGITDEKGNQYESIQDARDGLTQQLTLLKEQKEAGEITNEEYQNGVEKISEQARKVVDVQNEATKLNEVLGVDIEKNIKMKEIPSLPQFEDRLGRSIWKRVNLNVPISPVSQALGLAKGTSHHPGGLAVLGDGRGANAGPELYQTPEGSIGISPADDTLFNLPRGTKVWSARDTKKMIKDTLDNSRYLINRYANGIGSKSFSWVANGGWSESIMNGRGSNIDSYGLSGMSNSQLGIANNIDMNKLNLLERIAKAVEREKNVVMDGRSVGRLVEPHVTEKQNFEENRKNRFKR